MPLRKPLEVVGFVEEEGRFSGLLGSAVMTGRAAIDGLASLRDRDGVTFAEAAARAGLDPGRIQDAVRGAGQIAAFVELHVEQGAVLEGAGIPVGVVTAIAGTHRLAVGIVGRADHAGATPMDARQGALLAGAEVVLAARKIAVESARSTVRATVGQLFVEPNVTSAVLELVRFVVDVRDVDAAERAEIIKRIVVAIGVACQRESLTYRIASPMSAHARSHRPRHSGCYRAWLPSHRRRVHAAHQRRQPRRAEPGPGCAERDDLRPEP